jgi:cytochrome c553
VPTFPKLAGQHAVYVEAQLHAFKSGDRKNAMMAPFAAGLSDTDISDLAAYFEAQK